MRGTLQVVCVAVIVAALASAGWAVTIETVPVGHVGNAADSMVPTVTGMVQHGRVDYAYRIGTYEVSNAEYGEFLNSVATVGDPHGLYNTDMGGGWNDIGGISRTGSGMGGDPWVYSTRAGRANRPVNYVSFWDACRFANWLHNGQQGGGQELGTTENGAYFLNGVTAPPSSSIAREADWKWAVTSQDEWYKAAYHKNDGVTANYFSYPTGSDTFPTIEAPPGTDMTNGSANYNSGIPPFVYADPTYYTTECGAYGAKPSSSPYGTFDQGGNLSEWTEAIIYFKGGPYRRVRGGGGQRPHR